MKLPRWLVIGMLTSSVLAVLAAAGWLLWPAFYEYWAVRPLIEKMKVAATENDIKSVVAASDELNKIGAPAVRWLIELMKHPNDQVRWRAQEALLFMEDNAQAAIPAMIQALMNESKDVRETACMMLENQGAHAELAIPSLTEALRDEEPSVRGLAALALGEIGPAAHKAIPMLSQLLNDSDSWVRLRTIHALQSLDAISRVDAVAVLSDLVQSDDRVVRAEASDRLREIDPAAASSSGASLVDH